MIYNAVFTSIMIEKLRCGALRPRKTKQFSSDEGELLHVVVIPSYREPWEVLNRTVRSLAEQSLPLERRCLLIAFEAHDPTAWEMERQIRMRFGSFFSNIWFTHHVFEEGEEPGKSSNENHAVRWLYEEPGKSSN